MFDAVLSDYSTLLEHDSLVEGPLDSLIGDNAVVERHYHRRGAAG